MTTTGHKQVATRPHTFGTSIATRPNMTTKRHRHMKGSPLGARAHLAYNGVTQACNDEPHDMHKGVLR